MLAFDIIDTGIGIAPDQAKALFQPFQQADASSTRQFGGTGLGLALSKKLAEQLGGTITLDSTPGRGTTFRVTIAAVNVPRRPEPADAHSITQDGSDAAGGSPEFNLDCRILLVEDAPDNQFLLTSVLRRVGARITVAGNGREALDLLLPLLRQAEQTGGGVPFDVILMDMQMPILDGYETTRQIRQAGFAGPIIALTAHAMDSDRTKCLNAGCNAFATKPIVRKELLCTIREKLAEAKASPAGGQQAPAVDQARRFLAGLPAQAEAIGRALDERDLPSLANLAHDLRPTAGDLGFEAVNQAAGLLEELAETAEELGTITAAVRELVEACRRACETHAGQDRPG
jgi:CheY-like chemotaxis protein